MSIAPVYDIMDRDPSGQESLYFGRGEILILTAGHRNDRKYEDDSLVDSFKIIFKFIIYYILKFKIHQDVFL